MKTYDLLIKIIPAPIKIKLTGASIELCGIIQYFQRLLTISKTFIGVYKFSLQDFLIYLRYAESPGRRENFPKIQIIEDNDDSFIHFKIGKYAYYWPRICDQYGTWALAHMHQEVFEPAESNPHSYEYRKLKLKNGDIVIDAGACEGFFTRYVLEKGAKVIAIEPVKILADALGKTYSADIRHGNVKVIQTAIGSYTSKGHLSMNNARIFESHLGTFGEEVNVIKLDDLIATRIDFIKMDIEGGEVDALYGAQNIIKQFKPKLSIAVYHKYENAQKIIEYLREVCPEYTVTYRCIYASGNERPRPMMVYAYVDKKELQQKL
jgi:FkbM family methyltransferase